MILLTLIFPAFLFYNLLRIVLEGRLKVKSPRGGKRVMYDPGWHQKRWRVWSNKRSVL